MKVPTDHNHSMVQRIRVGLIGLVSVVLLIGLASAIIGSASRVPVAAETGVPANLSIDNGSGEGSGGEALAEIGAAPLPSNTATAQLP